MRVFVFLLLLFFVNQSSFSGEKEISNDTLNEYFKTDINYEEFFLTLKSSLLSGKQEQVASLNLYPIRVNYPSGSVYYETKEQFLVNYEKIITPQMLERVKQQTFDSLFYNYNGLNIGFGDVWFSGICQDAKLCENTESIKVWAFNVIYIEES